jgi:hypothetical protein
MTGAAPRPAAAAFGAETTSDEFAEWKFALTLGAESATAARSRPVAVETSMIDRRRRDQVECADRRGSGR